MSDIHSIQVTRLTIRPTRRALMMCTLDFKVGHTVHTCFNGSAGLNVYFFFYLKLYLLIHFHRFKMPRLSKGLRGQWTAAMLQNAMTAIHNGMPVREAARAFGVPRRTLRNHIATGIETKISWSQTNTIGS